MKKLLILGIAGLFVLTSCHKNTTARNVKKTLEVGTWKVARFIESDVNITTQFKDVSFSFDDNMAMNLRDAKEDTTIVGTWEVPSNAKRPANLFIYLPKEYTKTENLSDDWIVIFQDPDELHLERLNGKFGKSDECILRTLK